MFVLTLLICLRLSLDINLSSISNSRAHSSVIIKDFSTWLSHHLFPTHALSLTLWTNYSTSLPIFAFTPLQSSTTTLQALPFPSLFQFWRLKYPSRCQDLLSFHFFHVIVHTIPILQPHGNFLSFPPNYSIPYQIHLLRRNKAKTLSCLSSIF